MSTQDFENDRSAKFRSTTGPDLHKLEEELRRAPRDQLLNERESTHGSFTTNAAISQGLKALFRGYGHQKMIPAHQEALDMIALKLSRILSGQAGFKDHWDDIAGYSKLGAEACE